MFMLIQLYIAIIVVLIIFGFFLPENLMEHWGQIIALFIFLAPIAFVIWCLVISIKDDKNFYHNNDNNNSSSKTTSKKSKKQHWQEQEKANMYELGWDEPEESKYDNKALECEKFYNYEYYSDEEE